MRSAKNSVVFYALAAIPPSIYAVLSALAPYCWIFAFLFRSFIVCTLVLLRVGPYRFLAVSRNRKHDKANTIWWADPLSIGFSLVAAGAFAEFLCGLGGGDRVLALDGKDYSHVVRIVRI